MNNSSARDWSMNRVQHEANFYRDNRYSMDKPRHQRIGGYTVLIGQDWPPGEPTEGTWKYKIVAPLSTWSVGFNNFEEAYAMASLDCQRS